jgi:hypothetical protein
LIVRFFYTFGFLIKKIQEKSSNYRNSTKLAKLEIQLFYFLIFWRFIMLKQTKLKLALAISGALLAFGASNAQATVLTFDNRHLS